MIEKTQFEQFLQEMNEWQTQTFVKATAVSKLHHLKEEIEELIEAHKTGAKGIDIRHEYADCFILLFGSAMSHGLPFTAIEHDMKTKMEINKKRKWGTPDANGVVNHIK